MSSIIRFSLALFLLVFISCNPDEDLDNNGNSGNNGNNGNNGGGNTINPVSYPEIVNLLEGNWYGDSVVAYNSDGTQFIVMDTTGTLSVGYFTFSANDIGTADFTPPSEVLLAPPYESLLVSKYPASVTITDGSWSGTGIESLASFSGLNPSYAWELNGLSDKSYSVVVYTTPCFNITTPTIQYGIECGNDIRLLPQFSQGVGFVRIHTLNSTTLKLIAPYDGIGYVIFSFTKQQ
jgi:hypothetical protein